MTRHRSGLVTSIAYIKQPINCLYGKVALPSPSVPPVHCSSRTLTLSGWGSLVLQVGG
ncbi:Uncharacterized protein FWK35_00032713 [Aphis craccivora]|uniref:Uncharacterized protein n=1 Tax=Aphis craccivora TaxID=307492 RepID=A0A6G0VJ74_APHCR|nr:Uncharacterized protein FWK35_00032713 [Aphis craccivora]